jgi:lipid-A-disaccharide synthase
MRRTYPDAVFIVPQPTGLTFADYPGLEPDDSFFFVPAPAYDLRKVCDLAWVKSGTGTLETAILKTPMTVVYKVAPISYFLAKRLVTIPYVSLVNILAQKGLVTELLQDEATPESLSKEAITLLEDSAIRKNQIKGFDAIQKSLGLGHSSKASVNATNEILKMLRKKP